MTESVFIVLDGNKILSAWDNEPAARSAARAQANTMEAVNNGATVHLIIEERCGWAVRTIEHVYGKRVAS